MSIYIGKMNMILSGAEKERTSDPFKKCNIQYMFACACYMETFKDLAETEENSEYA